MRREQVVVTRGQIGQWASYVGGAALLMGVIGFLWQGGLTNYLVAVLAIGIGGIALWALMTPQEFRAFVTGRQVRYGTMAVFSTLLLIGIVVLVYIVLQRSAIVVDMTVDNRFSLSAETRDVLKSVTRDIQLTGFYSPRMLQQREVDDQFFRLYQSASNGRVHVVYIDPEEQPATAQAFGVSNDGAVFIAYLKPDGSVDMSTVAPVPRSPRQERDVTQAISRLLLSGSYTVYFETSHGELDPLDNTQQGLSAVNNGIRQNGLITMPLDLKDIAQKGDKIPGDASAVIMARPLTDLSDQEIAVVDAYLNKGGALFLMADVLFTDNAFLAQKGAFNQYLWDHFGIRALDAVVVDPAASLRTPLNIISATVYTNTDIGARLNPAQTDGQTLFQLTRALEVNDNPPVSNGRVIMSSASSYGETDLKTLAQTNTYQYDKDKDLPGPLTTVAWAWNQQTDAKILLVGDADFVTNGQVSSPLGNSILFTDGLAWMTGFGAKVKFSPKAFTTTPLLFVSGQVLDEIAFVTIIVMPGVVFLAGLIVWMRRSRR
jgi:ABC-type uncharacterized transport system involved in gliding motility auxiliary subunit